MRILLLSKYGRLGASSRVRSYQYLPYLEKHSVLVDVAPLLDDTYVKDLYAGSVSKWRVLLAYIRRTWKLLNLGSYDLIWLEKEAYPWLPAYFELIFLRRKIPVVVDYDDAVFHRYDTHQSALVQFLLGQKIDRIMSAADMVIAGSEYLIGRANLAGAQRVEKLPTVVNMSCYPILQKRQIGSLLTIGWIGSPTTTHYLLPLISVFRSLRKNFNLRVLAIGASKFPEFDNLVDVVPWSENTEATLISQIDIGIMPLPDEPFEQGKCAYKLIQYMASSKPVVASPVGENIHVVRPGVNGFLATSEAEWIFALSNLCNDSVLRERCGQAGRVFAEETYSLEVTAPRLLALFQSLSR